MVTAILMAALVLAPAPQATDTVIPVDRGVALNVDNFQGDVVVRAWSRDAVRVRADLSSRQRLDVVRSGSEVRVRTRTIQGGPRETHFQIDIPRWMDVRIEGNQVDVDVDGTEAEISVETVGGDIQVRGGRGLVRLRTIQGEISVRQARGRVEATSVNEEIFLDDVEGDIYVETTNGDVVMRGIRTTTARATTVNGDMVYEGAIEANGRYVFSTHNGDVMVTMAENASATVSVSTYHGEFRSEFPVRLTGTSRDRQFTFTLGSGSARVELESFNGEIVLRRP